MKSFRFCLIFLLILGLNAACDNMGKLDESNPGNSANSISPFLSQNNLVLLLKSASYDLSNCISHKSSSYQYGLIQGPSNGVLRNNIFTPLVSGNYQIKITDTVSGTNGIVSITVTDALLSYDFTTGSLTGTYNNVPNTTLLNFLRNDNNIAIATFFGIGGLLRQASPFAPRFELDPSTSAPKGLLIEESTQNLIVNSINFSTAWTLGVNAVLTPGFATSPDGTNNASRLQLASMIGSTLTTTVAGTTNQTYTASLFAKSPATNQHLTLKLIGTDAKTGYFPLTNQWQRFSITGKQTDPTTMTFTIGNDGGGNLETVDTEIWGAQLEANPIMTSPIFTSGQSATRNADLVALTQNGWYNPQQGTIVIEWDVNNPKNSVDSFIFGLSVGQKGTTVADGIYLLNSANNNGTIIEVIGGGVPFLGKANGRPPTAATGRHRAAISYTSAEIRFYENGNFGGNILNPKLPASPTTMTLGYSAGHGPTSYLDGHIKILIYNPTPSADSDLTTLSQ